jgi:hypothetical protein
VNCAAPYPGRDGLEDAVSVGVEAGDDVDRFARVSLKNSKRKEIARIEVAEQIEFMAATHCWSAPNRTKENCCCRGNR